MSFLNDYKTYALIGLGGIFFTDMYRQIVQRLEIKEQILQQRMILNAPQQVKEKDSPAQTIKPTQPTPSMLPFISSYLLYTICVTGGPQSGKTTALATIRDFLVEKGFQVFILPSVKELNMNHEISLKNLTLFSTEGRAKLIALHIQQGLDLYAHYCKLATLVKKSTVILSEGGLLDDTLDFTDHDWETLQEYDETITKARLRDKLYQAVIHLVTSAHGDIANFRFDTTFNAQPKEKQLKDAQVLDTRLQRTWQGNQNHIIIDNKGKNLSAKISYAVDAIQKIVGLPVKSYIVKKYQLEKVMFPNFISKIETHLVDTYLTQTNKNEIQKLRQRRNGSLIVYQHIIRSINEKGNDFHEIKRPISASEYVQLLKWQDTSIIEFQRLRYTFIFNNVYYTIDSFDFKGKNCGLLITKENDQIPPFVNAFKDVTKDPDWNYQRIAKELFRWDQKQKDLQQQKDKESLKE